MAPRTTFRHLSRLSRLLAILGLLFALQPQSAVAQATDSFRIRKSACALTAQERADFVQAVRTLKTTFRPGETMSVYDQFVWWHLRWADEHLIHARPSFLPWHRMLLDHFEQELRAVDPGVAVPYWDWTEDPTGERCIWLDDFMGGNGDPDDFRAVTTGPFRKGEWELVLFDNSDSLFDDEDEDVNTLPFITRAFGTDDAGPRMPTRAEVDAALGVSGYDVEPYDDYSNWTCSFRSNLEGYRRSVEPVIRGPHNLVHIYVGGELTDPEGKTVDGTMANNVSPNDPVFWLHHANIDRLWAMWQSRWGHQYRPLSAGGEGQNLFDTMTPWDVTPDSILRHHSLGYRYAEEARDAAYVAALPETPCVPIEMREHPAH